MFWKTPFQRAVLAALSGITSQLIRHERLLKTMSDTLDSEITEIDADIVALTNAVGGVAANFTALNQQLSTLTAELAQTASVPTPDQINRLNSIHQQLQQETSTLATLAAPPAAGNATGNATGGNTTDTGASGGDPNASGATTDSGNTSITGDNTGAGAGGNTTGDQQSGDGTQTGSQAPQPLT